MNEQTGGNMDLGKCDKYKLQCTYFDFYFGIKAITSNIWYCSMFLEKLVTVYELNFCIIIFFFYLILPEASCELFLLLCI